MSEHFQRALRLIQLLDNHRPEVIKLATAVSLAARVEIEFLRATRLQVLPMIDSGTEADLYFSPLVESKNPTSLILRNDVSLVLQQRLANDRELLSKTHKILQKIHVDAPPVIRLQEEIIFIALSHPESEDIQSLLEQVLAGLIRDKREGLARWALWALPRLPEKVRKSTKSSMLELAALTRLRTDRKIDFHLPDDAVRTLLPWILPTDIQTILAGVRREGDILEFSFPQAPDTNPFRIPNTDPLFLEILEGRAKRVKETQVVIKKNQTQRVRVHDNHVKFRTAIGDLFTAPSPDDPEMLNLEVVADIQRQLKELGYYKMEVDGQSGTATRKAVQAFQKVLGFSADGRINKSLKIQLDKALNRKKMDNKKVMNDQKMKSFDGLTLSIFISHRIEDRSIALTISGALRLLSDGKLDPLVCEDIPGGTEWRDWIYDKIKKSDILFFLYTDKSYDWIWCFFEIGLFLGLNDINAGQIIFLKDPSIQELPSPLEKYQAYDATEEGIAKLLENLLIKGEFTDKKQINKNLFNNDYYALAIQDIIKVFRPLKIESEYFVRRAVFNLEHVNLNKGDKRFDDVTIGSDDSYTMQEILLATGKLTHWHNLYDKFRAKGQESWLNEIKQTIENIEIDNALTYVMKPFEAKNGQRFLPFLTRIEKKPSEEDAINRITPIRIYVIFIPFSDIEEKSGLVDIVKAADPKYLMEAWQTYLPTSVIRVKWKKKSSSMAYLNEDMDGEPIAYAINPTFANFYDFNFNDFPDPDGDNPVTISYLLKRVKNYVVDGDNYISKIETDQAEVAQKIIFEGKEAFARVLFRFNDNHPYFPNSSYLPCLVSKSTVGDINGPHITYLAIMYVRVNDFK